MNCGSGFGGRSIVAPFTPIYFGLPAKVCWNGKEKDAVGWLTP
jgi:hypothetical protein